MIFSLGYYAFSALVNFISSISLCLFVYSKNKKSILNKTFAFFCLAVAQWSLFYFIWLKTANLGAADFLLRTCMIGVIFMPSTFTHFIIHLLDLKVSKAVIYGNYFVSTLLALSVYTPLYANPGGPYLMFPYWAKPRVLFPLHLLHFAVNVLYSHYKMHEALRKGNRRSSRNQIKYVFLGTSIGYVAGVMNYFCWYRIPIPPFLNVAVSLYVVMVAYAIVVHRLMDIEVIIRRVVVFASLFIFVYGVFVAVAMLTQEIFTNKWIGFLISAIIITLTHGPLKTYLVDLTDRFLFQKKYNPTQMIRDFSRSVLTELNLDEAAKKTVETLSSVLRPESCALLVPGGAQRDKFVIKSSIGISDSAVEFTEESVLIASLKTHGSIGVDKCPEMRSLGAVLCVGVKNRSELMGLLALGKKKSDEDYTQQDIEVLQILGEALGVSFRNASTFEEARRKENLAALGTLASGIKHDISKPIAKVGGDIQDFLSRRTEGLHKNADETLSESYSLLTRCKMAFDNVITISAKYTEAVRPNEKGETESINIAEIVESVMSVMDSEAKSKGIALIKDIAGNLPEVHFDRDYLHQILWNLIRNAVYAVKEANKPQEESIVSIIARDIGQHVRLTVADTGTGIHEKNLKKIFESWFTTKPDGEGTGLGLALVKELVERSGGNIQVESKLGIGTSFILDLKK